MGSYTTPVVFRLEFLRIWYSEGFSVAVDEPYRILGLSAVASQQIWRRELIDDAVLMLRGQKPGLFNRMVERVREMDG